MKIANVYVKERYKPACEQTPPAVFRSKTPDGKPNYEISFEAGFYMFSKAGKSFAIPASNVIAHEYEDEPPPRKK